MQIPEARWIVWGTLLVFALMIAIYVSFYFRDLAVGEDEDEKANRLTDLRRMRDEGFLDEEEYSRARSQVADIENKNGAGDLNGKPEKKFLTLAEAQKLKERDGNEGIEQNDEEKDSGDLSES